MRRRLQRSGRWSPSMLWLAMFVLIGSVGRTFAGDRFVPDQHLPEGAILYARADISRLADEFWNTPIGKILSHPGGAQAVGRLPSFVAGKINEAASEFRDTTGMGLLEGLALLRGQVAVAQYDLRVQAPPTTVFAVELGDQKEGIRRLLDGITRSWKESGKEPEIVDIDGVKAESWPVIRHGNEVDSFVSAELGSHLVLSVGKSTRFEAAVRRFKSEESGAGGIGDQPAMKAALEDCSVSDRALVAAVDVGGFLAFLEEASVGFKPGAPDEFVPSRVLTLLGLRNATSLGYALGFHDGDLEGRLRLGFDGESSGLLRAMANSMSPVRDVEGALANIPVEATSIVTKSVAVGDLYTQCVAEVKTHFPEHFDDFQNALRGLEQMFGISFDDDVATLGRADWYVFSMNPPAGSLFNDGFALVRKSEFGAYRKVLEKLARASEAELTVEVAGTTVQSASIRSPLVDGSSGAFTWIGIASWCDLDDEWTLVANQPRTIRRFLEYYDKATPLSTDVALSALVKEQASADVGAVLRFGPNLISRYNDVVTFLQVLTPMFSKFLDPLDVEVAHLPIGEVFLEAISDGTIRFDFSSSHIDLHGRAVTTAVVGSPAGFVALGAGAIGAGAILPALVKSRNSSRVVSCQYNLRMLARMSRLYADTENSGYFPYTEEGGAATLQVLVDFFGDLEPTAFVCLSSGQTAGEVGADGKLELTKETCSYEIFPGRLSSVDDAILAYDRFPHHDGKRNVVMTNATALSLSEEEFQRRLEGQKKRVKEK